MIQPLLRKNGENLFSIYTNERLRHRLKSYQGGNSLISLDVDDTIRPSPVKHIFAQSFFKPSRWIKHPEWLIDFIRVFPIAILEGWPKERIETFALQYAEKNIMPKLDLDLSKLVGQESPAFYPWVSYFLGQYPRSNILLLSRAFKEVVENTAKAIGINASHTLYRQDKKAQTLLTFLKEHPSIEQVLIFGDLKNDAECSRLCKDSGYKTDFVQVMKDPRKGEIYPETTVAISRNWFNLYRLVK